MIIDDRGINPFAGSEKEKWLSLPERLKRFTINNHPLLHKRDVDCDEVFIAAGLITKVYQNISEAEETDPWDVYNGILAKQYRLPVNSQPGNEHEYSDSEWAKYFQVITKYQLEQ
jgi:hypothetical protein